jgi:D-amino-acid dehydrogenase
MSVPRVSVTIVGAGIVGIATAALLSEAGHTVTVIDRTGIALETSKGNAAALAFSDILPLASPKIMLKAPKWLLDPLGPLSIRPSYLPQLAPGCGNSGRQACRPGSKPRSRPRAI